MALTKVNSQLVDGSITTDTSGNVGIGTSSPSSKLQVLTASSTGVTFQNAGGSGLKFYTDSTAENADFIVNYYGGGGSTTGTAYILQQYGTERMRVDTAGRLLINKSSSADNNARIQAFSTAGNGNSNWIASLAGGSGGTNANQTVGYMVGQTNCQVYAAWDGSGNARNSVYVSAVSQGVQLSSGASSWSAISDERQKDIIEPIADAIDKVSSLRAVIGKYKNDEEGKRRSFLIAQDVQAVLPEAVTVEDEGQDTEKLLLAYSDVIPLLVASIKELNAKVTSLEEQLLNLGVK